VLCDGVCVDVQTDPMHCGECGNAVPPDVDCVEGEPACPLQGFELCDGVCVDVLNDDDNCGECGAACGDSDCMGNGCCHVFVHTTRPRSCAEICADAGMTCECPMASSASYTGKCGLDAVNVASCDDAPAAMITCGAEMCDCAIDRIDCGCRP
jgi:hypothetical protein